MRKVNLAFNQKNSSTRTLFPIPFNQTKITSLILVFVFTLIQISGGFFLYVPFPDATLIICEGLSLNLDEML
ncbi:MAG: hypothetical protein ACJAQ4_001527 [Cryomorphaceae bacterium]|jgi:hypothetical protein